ncbi:OLC1v1030763C1 [Oldenlandia corymbosa var. corymbosa]|uniref:OLC1v1030763C1 n=1 Tax=Oldenlandia corymbosa var. corymbosa TaxID=529605 RepID=A0AAV1CGR6_OLDCO|nr:OLC1v1030763C1 [Oldenlandia corymbosa var. corymbosa]
MQLTNFHTQLSRDNLRLSLLGYLIEDFEVDDRVMQDYMVANWPVTVRVLHYDRNFFILKFMNRAEMMAILDNGPYAVNGGLLILHRCYDHEDLVLDSIKIEKMSIWVRLHGVPITSMNYRSLEDLARRVGDVEVIKQDCVSLRKITYVREKVWIKPGDPLVPSFYFTKKNGKMAKIKCKFEHMHKFCQRCGRLGHPLTRCYFMEDDALTTFLNNFFAARAAQFDSPLLVDVNKPLCSGAIRGHAHKQKRSTRLPEYKVAAMLDFYDSVPDTYIQDGFTISETDEETPVPWYPWSPHNPDDHQLDNADEEDDGNQSDDPDQDDINPDNNNDEDESLSGGSDQFMDEINADNFVDDDGPPIQVEGRSSLYAGVEVDYSRSSAPAAGEDTVSSLSGDQGFQISDDSHNAIADEVASDSVSVNFGVRMTPRLSTRYSTGGGGFPQHRRIPVNAKGRGNFKKKGSHGSSSSDLALPSLLDEFSQTNSDPEEFFMKARMAVSESDLPDSMHTAQQSFPYRPATPGWCMKIVDEDFDDSVASDTSLNSTGSRKRHSEDSLPDLERPEKRRSNTVMHEEVQNLFKDLEMAWEEGKQHARASGIEPDQSPLFQ